MDVADGLVPIAGIVDLIGDYGFVRTSGYLLGLNDVFIDHAQLRRYGLRCGDAVTGATELHVDGAGRGTLGGLARPTPSTALMQRNLPGEPISGT